MPITISNANIKAFRGIPCTELPLEGNSLLLIGENGTGKSSIVDAMEFFFTGEVSSLKGMKGISLQRHVPHKNFGVDEVMIELSFGDEKLVRTFNKTPEPSENLNDYFNVAQNGKFILRRKELLQVIDARPAERFDAITDLIGINSLKQTEKEMRLARGFLNKEVDQKKKLLENIIQDISNIIGQKIENASDVFPILNNLLENNNLPIIESVEDVSKHKEKLFRFTKSSYKVDMFYSLQEILEKSKSINNDNICESIRNLNKEFSLLMQNNLTNSRSILDLFKIGKKILKQEENIESCPLCEQPIKRKLLLDQIELRYETLDELRINLAKIIKESSELVEEIKNSIADFKYIIKKMDLISELDIEKKNLSREVDLLEDINREFSKSINKDIRIPSVEIIKESDKINKILVEIVEKCTNLESEIELNKEEKIFLEFVETIIKATSKIEDLKKADDALKTSTTNFEIAEKIYDKFSSLKSTKIQEIFDSIKSDMQKYYSFLHPDDPHKNIDLKISGKGTSAVLEIESFGRPGEDPRAYTSEGHLDTLGLCIFLAFVKKFNRKCNLIILDDIVTTVDSPHRESICRLLFEEFKRKQFIITTHDGLWFKQVSSLIDAYGLVNKFMKCVIYRWDEDNGPSIKYYKFKWERIPERIDAGERACAGNEIRQYLEWVLENICKSTGASLPIIDRGFTVGELIGPARGRLKELIADDETRLEIRDTFKEIDKSIMGNLLSHHNELSANASINDVKRFFESVNKLHMLVSCPSCKRFLSYESNADRMICSKRCSDPVIINTNQL